MSTRFPRSLLYVFAVLALLALPRRGAAQEPKGPEMPKTECTECHTCDVPTGRNPCLKACPRTVMVHQTSPHKLAEAPDTLMLADLVDVYQSVHFDHRLHARMAEMGRDCATCHHYSPPGKVPPCRECHSVQPESEDLRKPNLKGAYHRQCLACHAEWSHETKCYVCHIPIQGQPISAGVSDPTDIMGKSHPMVTVPVRKVYHTPDNPGPIVTFQHKEHVDLFGFRCVDCHHQENCGNCHDLQKTSSGAQLHAHGHAVCERCHDLAQCTKCHDTRERPGFTHNATGWPLNPYHNKLDCWACHPTGKRISRINKMCVNCHPAWGPENFRHAVTGLKLDETHAQMDCADCHPNRRFEEDPVCSDCHDDGRTAKTAPPGMLLKHPGS